MICCQLPLVKCGVDFGAILVLCWASLAALLVLILFIGGCLCINRVPRALLVIMDWQNWIDFWPCLVKCGVEFGATLALCWASLAALVVSVVFPVPCLSRWSTLSANATSPWLQHKVSEGKSLRDSAKLLDKQIAIETARLGPSRMAWHDWDKLQTARNDKWDKAESVSRDAGFKFMDRDGNWVNDFQRDLVGMSLCEWCKKHNLKYS